jgi:hypothetical protein
LRGKENAKIDMENPEFLRRTLNFGVLFFSQEDQEPRPRDRDGYFPNPEPNCNAAIYSQILLLIILLNKIRIAATFESN